ncbi:hypothetical protein IWW38_001719 [Coemansia aciculifera]|uniref:Uncharacterized protein n=1 Tax=Coemansia aciculifera TaxID=417176 RepID=A0ACC1M5J7_9FUNG|nr:hypothetical protein IWW38_001719 [Coemansia aciculifera]
MSDDITTIFVGGIPDDMKEREFQNMFTFSPGFEAATLKFPSPDDGPDKDGQKKQIIGFAKFHTRMEALEARDILTGRLVDAEKHCVLKAEMAKKNLHTKRGLSSLGLSSAVGATFGFDAPNVSSSVVNFQQQQQQIPQSALPKMQHMGSQKPPISVPRTASLTNATMASATAAATVSGHHRPEHLRISGTRAFNPFNDAPMASAPIMGTKAHRGFGSSSAFSSNSAQVGLDHAAVSSAVAAAAVAAAAQMPGTAGVMGGFMHADQLMASHSSMMLNRRGSIHGSTPVSSSMATNSSASFAAAAAAAQSGSVYTNGYQQAMQQAQLQSMPASEPSSPDGQDPSFHMSAPQSVQPQQQHQGQQPQQPKGLASHRPAVLDIAALQPRLNQLSLGQMSATTGSMMTPMGGAPYSASAVSTPGGMMLPMATTRSVNSNDQNPPCNTIYVGNLPIGAKEDELWTIFQNSLGYKRMSYKAKPNSGPMCFVEFESIDFATLAMNELDGRMLTNSVGSGIRLSYSKNPLGVRSQSGNNPTTPTTALSSAAAQAAASVAGGNSGSGGFSQHLSSAAPSPYGYSAMATPSLLQNSAHQQRMHGVSPVHQGIPASALHHHQHKDASSPSPPAQLQQQQQQQQQHLFQQQMAYGGHHYQQQHHHHHHHHQLSMSSSSATSPMPSPSTANANDDMTAVPKDALSFLHQPIHQLHKQATSGDHTTTSTGPSTPPLTSTM